MEEDEFDSKPLGMKFGISAGEAHDFNELFSFFSNITYQHTTEGIVKVQGVPFDKLFTFFSSLFTNSLDLLNVLMRPKNYHFSETPCNQRTFVESFTSQTFWQ